MDEERHAAIVAMLEGNAEIESEEEPEELESQSVEEESDASDDEELEEEETQVEASSEDEEETEVEEGHRVPYNRFKQINDQRHQLKSQLEEKERFIAQLEQQMKARKKPEPTYEEYEEEDIFDGSGSYEHTDEISYLKEQNRAIQVKFATMELEKEIGAALEQYPNVPEEHIWDSIAQDGNASAMSIAEQYSSWVAGVEEAAIARYLKEQGGDAPGAPPRPKRKQTAKSNPSEEEWKPRNTDEAREAMIAYLRS
tara:strand:+ start:1515 stop:2279 length:765 start_codon:yes stop_codon:yes gene_type:complete